MQIGEQPRHRYRNTNELSLASRAGYESSGTRLTSVSPHKYPPSVANLDIMTLRRWSSETLSTTAHAGRYTSFVASSVRRPTTFPLMFWRRYERFIVHTGTWYPRYVCAFCQPSPRSLAPPFQVLLSSTLFRNMCDLSLPAPPRHIAEENILVYCAHIDNKDPAGRPLAKTRRGDIRAMEAALLSLDRALETVDQEGFVEIKIYKLLDDAAKQLRSVRSGDVSKMIRHPRCRLFRARRDLDQIHVHLAQELPKYRDSHQITGKQLREIQDAEKDCRETFRRFPPGFPITQAELSIWLLSRAPPPTTNETIGPIVELSAALTLR